MREFTTLPIPPNWKPEELASQIVKETERWWNQGWTFVEANTDALMENVVLQFERDV
jgi:hypothetical protein